MPNDPALPLTLPASAVFQRNGEAFASSRTVAEMFGKRHDHVLRDIDGLTTSPDLGGCGWFRPVISEVAGGNGATLRTRSFDMTRDGFTLLAMGFTGTTALRFKMLYINAFNRMDAELRSRPVPGIDLDDPRSLRTALLGYTERVIELESAVIRLEDTVGEMSPKADIVDVHVAQRNHDSLATFVRSLAGVNSHAIKRDLASLKYLYRVGRKYRVYSEFRDTLFSEKLNGHSGDMDIFVTVKGRAEVAKLYKARKLTMKKAASPVTLGHTLPPGASAH